MVILAWQKAFYSLLHKFFRGLSFDIENTLLEGDNVIDFPIKPPSLDVYDDVAEVAKYE